MSRAKSKRSTPASYPADVPAKDAPVALAEFLRTALSGGMALAEGGRTYEGEDGSVVTTGLAEQLIAHGLARLEGDRLLWNDGG